MKIKFWKYDWEDALRIRTFLIAIGYNATIIGSLYRIHHSNNDIDIHLPQTEYSAETANTIMRALLTTEYEITDWGSLYLPNTIFGNLDIFFKGQTDEFDY